MHGCHSMRVSRIADSTKLLVLFFCWRSRHSARLGTTSRLVWGEIAFGIGHSDPAHKNVGIFRAEQESVFLSKAGVKINFSPEPTGWRWIGYFLRSRSKENESWRQSWRCNCCCQVSSELWNRSKAHPLYQICKNLIPGWTNSSFCFLMVFDCLCYT